MTRPPGIARPAVVLLALALACDAGDAPAGDDPRAPGTVEMAERLDEIVRTRDLTKLPYANSLRIQALRTLDVPDGPRGEFLHAFSLGREQLRAGRTEEAISSLEDARELLESGRAPAPPRIRREVEELIAVAWLRVGEQENCLSRPGTEGCLRLPGTSEPHRDPRGSRNAVRAYREILRKRPDDLGSRWLLNLAHMSLGQHPDSVREEWLVPRPAFASGAPEGAVEPFVDRAAEAGVDVRGLAGGAAVDDFDADGEMEIVASSMGFRDSLRYFDAAGDGSFVERTREAGLGGLTGGLNLIQADYDGDGCLDVLVLRGGWKPPGWPNSLLRGGCDGTFADVTREAGIYSEHPGQTAAWGDYDSDGDLDLFVGNETSGDGGRAVYGQESGSEGQGGPSRGGEDGSSPHPSELYRNDGDGTFTDVAPDLGLDVVGMVKGAAWGDYDNDGWIDLYVSRYGEPNLLFRNLGAGPGGEHRGFREVGEEAGVTEPGRSFPLWWWDYDNDGWLDLFVAGYGALARDVAAEYLGRPHDAVRPRLYRNRGVDADGSHRGFEDVTDRVGLGDRVLYAMGSNHGDLDNDGWPDFYVGTGDPDYRQRMPSRVFRNDGGRSFRDVTVPGGFGHLFKGHAGSFADVDGDGDQDLYVVYGGAYEGDVAPNVLLENPGHGNAWVTLRLEGAGPGAPGGGSNRFGVGSRVEVTVETPSGDREIHHLVGTGGSFGANSLQAEIGLGDATRIRELEVRWAGSGTRDVWTDVPLERVLRVREGAPEVEPLEARPDDPQGR